MSTIREELRMVFWIVPLCLQPLIAIWIILRRQIRIFPIFLLYTLFVSARDLVLLFVKHNKRTYAWIYFLGEPLALLLGVAVIFELIWQLLRPYDALRVLGLRLFWASIAFASLGGFLLLRTSDSSQTVFLMQSVVLIERSARFAQVSILIVFILLISHFGLTWKHYTAGIVVGFGVSAGLQLALFELKSTPILADDTFRLLNSMAYNIAVLIWAAYFLPPRKETKPPRQLPALDLALWDEILRRYLHR
jgi:hypothetical protein